MDGHADDPERADADDTDWQRLSPEEIDPDWEEPIGPDSTLAAIERRFLALASSRNMANEKIFTRHLEIFSLLFHLKTATDETGELLSVTRYNEIADQYVGKTTAAEALRLKCHERADEITAKVADLRDKWSEKHPSRPFEYPKITQLIDLCRDDDDPKRVRLRRVNKGDDAIRAENLALNDKLRERETKISALLKSQQEVAEQLAQVTRDQLTAARERDDALRALAAAQAQIERLKTGIAPEPPVNQPNKPPDDDMIVFVPPSPSPPVKKRRGRPPKATVADDESERLLTKEEYQTLRKCYESAEWESADPDVKAWLVERNLVVIEGGDIKLTPAGGAALERYEVRPLSQAQRP
jgi:hypothetical protein